MGSRRKSPSDYCERTFGILIKKMLYSNRLKTFAHANYELANVQTSLIVTCAFFLFVRVVVG